MSESKEYVSQVLENGSIHISEEVVASIVKAAVEDVDGVFGLSTSISTMKSSGKSVRLVISENNEISVDCYVVVTYGCSVVEVAKNVQEAVANLLESTTGHKVSSVNVNISGITMPRSKK